MYNKYVENMSDMFPLQLQSVFICFGVHGHEISHFLRANLSLHKLSGFVIHCLK